MQNCMCAEAGGPHIHALGIQSRHTVQSRRLFLVNVGPTFPFRPKIVVLGDWGRASLVCFVVFLHLPKICSSFSDSGCLSILLLAVRMGEGAGIVGGVSSGWVFGGVVDAWWTIPGVRVVGVFGERSGGENSEGTKRSGGFLGGRALLGPGPAHQELPLHFLMKASNSVSFSAGISSLLMWLDAFEQSAKQKPRMNQRGHILQVPSQSTLSESPLLAKCVAHVSPCCILHDGGGDSFLTLLPSLPFVRLFFFDGFESSSFLSAARLFGAPPSAAGVSLAFGVTKVRGSVTLKVPKRTALMDEVKFRMESSTWVRHGRDMHSSNQS